MMASLTDRNLQNAMTCLLDRDVASCAVTISDEEEIDALEKRVDQQGVVVLLRYQPVASDLRQIVSAMKLGGNRERIADQAVKIAVRARKLTKHPSWMKSPYSDQCSSRPQTFFATASAPMPTAMSGSPAGSGFATRKSTR